MNTPRLRQLITPYFDLLQAEFGEIARNVDDLRMSSDAAAEIALADPSLRRQFMERIAPEFLTRVIAFWQQNETAVVEAVIVCPGLKVTFGGDIGPQRNFRQIERGALYFDTAIVPDPLLRVARIPGPVMATEKAKLLIKYALELVWARDLYLTNVDPPIAVLIPDRELGGTRSEFDARWSETEPWALLYWSTVFGHTFTNYAEIVAHAEALGTTGALLDSMKHPELFRMSAEAGPDPHAQWAALLEYGQAHFDIREISELDRPGFLLSSVRGRLMMANDILNTATTYRGHPLVGAPLSYYYTAWRGTAVQPDVARELGRELHVDFVETNSLLASGLDWLGNVSVEDLVKLRSRGRMEEMRSLLRGEAGRLQNVSMDDAEGISREIDHHLEQAFRRHKEEVRDKDAAFRRELAVEGAGLLMSAVVAFQPLLLPAAPVWLAPIVGVVGAGTTVRDIGKRIGQQIRESRTLSSAPIAILLEAKEKIGTNQ